MMFLLFQHLYVINLTTYRTGLENNDPPKRVVFDDLNKVKTSLSSPFPVLILSQLSFELLFGGTQKATTVCNKD